MKAFNSILTVMMCFGMLAGCKQNPYEATVKPGQKNVLENPENQHQTPKVFSIEAPDLIECAEASTCSAEIIGHVPEPGKSILQFKALPSGATYDAASGLFTYVPAYDVVDVAAHPEQSLIMIPMTVVVRSSVDSVTEASRAITIVVKNRMRPVDLVVTGSSNVNEGAVLEQTVEVKSADFPIGPFSLTAMNAPVGTEVKPVEGNPNLFTVKFMPGYLFAGVKDTYSSTGYYKTINVSYQVSLPIGQSVKKDFGWRVNDIRQSPVVSAPETLSQGLDVNFSIRAEDMNGEVSPKINVSSAIPFGRLTTTTIVDTTSSEVAYPSKMVLVHWDQLRTSQLGTTTEINYEVCTQKKTGVFLSCIQKKTMVTLKADLHAVPKMDRSKWKAGEVKFARVGTPFNFAIPVLDSEDPNLPVDVKIKSSQPSAVSWKNGLLTINSLVEGMLQFDITAESIYGQTLTESFMAEVFPSSWANTVILTSNFPQNESTESAKLISSVEFLSTQFQVSNRTLALRESCMLTTEAFASAKIDEKTQDSLYQNIPSILISTPLADQVKGKIQEDLKTFGIGIKGRLSQVLPGTDISAMTLAVDSKSSLESPKVPAGLKGSLTAESKDPLVLDLDHLSSKCTPLFSLQKPAASVAVGVLCKNNGKTMTILGFELADVLLDQKDIPLLNQWMNFFLTGRGK